MSSLRNASTATIHQAANEIIEQVSQDSGVFETDASTIIPHFDIDGKCGEDILMTASCFSGIASSRSLHFFGH